MSAGRPSRRRSRRAFSLLEVMVAVALFGAVVTIILSAQAALVESDRDAANMSQAIQIGRCRMSELEEKELRLGFPEIEEKDTSTICCDEKEVPGFSCDWQIERVLLPQPQYLGGEGGAGSVFGGGLGLDGGAPSLASIASGMPSSLPSPAGTMLINPMGGAQLDFDAGLQNIGTSLQQSFPGGGAQGLLAMVFSIVYPSLKPVLEAAIRKVTVVIKWKEGPRDRDFTLIQYITNPSAAGLMAGMMSAGVGADGGIPANTGGGLPGAGGMPGVGGVPGVGGMPGGGLPAIPGIGR